MVCVCSAAVREVRVRIPPATYCDAGITSLGHLSPYRLGYLAKDSERYCQNDKGSHAIIRLYGPLRRPMSYVIVVPRQCVITSVSCLDVIAHGTELVCQGNNAIVSALRHVKGAI